LLSSSLLYTAAEAKDLGSAASTAHFCNNAVENIAGKPKWCHKSPYLTGFDKNR